MQIPCHTNTLYYTRHTARLSIGQNAISFWKWTRFVFTRSAQLNTFASLRQGESSLVRHETCCWCLFYTVASTRVKFHKAHCYAYIYINIASSILKYSTAHKLVALINSFNGIIVFPRPSNLGYGNPGWLKFNNLCMSTLNFISVRSISTFMSKSLHFSVFRSIFRKIFCSLINLFVTFLRPAEFKAFLKLD